MSQRRLPLSARIVTASIATAALVLAGLSVPLAAHAVTLVTNSASLKTQIEAPGASGVYQLTQNIGDPVTSDTRYQYMPSGTLTIDLHGFSVWSYDFTAAEGSTLTITDSTSGAGTLTIQAATISAGINTHNAAVVISGSVKVNATGTDSNPGIGGHYNGKSSAGDLTVKDTAQVVAIAGAAASGNGAAGIGGSAAGNGGNVVITDNARVTATASTLADSGASSGAGIGGGSISFGGTITVSGNAVVVANGGAGAAGIGGGKGQGIGSFSISDSANVTAIPGPNPTGITTPADSIGNGANANGTNHLVLNGGTWTIPNLSQQRFREDTSSATTIINFGIITNTATNAILTNNAAIQSPTGLVAMPVKNRNYTVYLNAGDGSLGESSASVDFHARTLSLAGATLPTPSRAGYTFTGWKFADNLAGPSVALTTDFSAKGTSSTGAPVEFTLVASYQFIKLASTAAVSVLPNIASYGTQQKVTATFAASATGPVNYSLDGGSPSIVAPANSGAIDLPANLSVGDHALTVTYGGDDMYLPGTATTTFSVSKIPTTMTGFLSASSGVIGSNFSVTPTLTGAIGAITIAVDGAVVGSTSTGTAFALPPLSVGTHSIAASFAGDATHAASSAGFALSVTAEVAVPPVLITPEVPVTAKIAVTAKRFAKNSKPKVTVKISALGDGKKATGKIAVYVGKKKVKTISITNKTVVKVTLPKKYSKAIKVRAKFLGSATILPATSKTLKLKVK